MVKFFDRKAEELLVFAKAKKRSLLADKITGDNIYKALVFFDKLYAQMNEAEKREFLSQLEMCIRDRISYGQDDFEFQRYADDS